MRSVMSRKLLTNILSLCFCLLEKTTFFLGAANEAKKLKKHEVEKGGTTTPPMGDL